MKYVSPVCLCAGFLWCLAAAPARADIATPDAGQLSSPQVVTALRALTELMDAAATLPETSALVSETKSAGPQNVPFTSTGVDSSNGPREKIVAARFGAVGLLSPTGETSFAAAYQAAAPAGFGNGGESHVVPTPSAPAPDLAGLASSSSAPLEVGNLAATQTVTPSVPIPATVLLLGGGLVALFPLRRSRGVLLEG